MNFHQVKAESIHIISLCFSRATASSQDLVEKFVKDSEIIDKSDDLFDLYNISLHHKNNHARLKAF